MATTSWYYNRVTGQVFSASGAEKYALDKSIMLEKLPGVSKYLWGPYATQAEAQAAAAQYPATAPTALAAVPTPGDVADKVLGTVGPVLVRVGEVVAGVVLLAIAANVILKQTTGVDVAGGAARAARTVGRV
jgi:hypothetical protein